MKARQVNILLLVLVVGLLFINIYNIHRVNEFERVLRYYASSTRAELDNLIKEQEAVQHLLHTLKEDQYHWAELSHQIETDLVEEGKVAVIVTVSINEKLSQSQLKLLYRPAGTVEWSEASLSDLGGLTYRAQLWLQPTQNWEYRVVEAHPQSTRGTSVQELALKHYCGTGDVLLRQYELEDDELTIAFCQKPRPLLPELQVEKITLVLRYRDGSQETVTLQGEQGYFKCRLQLNNKLQEIVVTAYYRDGEMRTAVLESPQSSKGDAATKPIPEPFIIKR